MTMVRRFTGRSLLGLLLVLAAGVAFGLLLVLVRAEWTPLHGLDHGVAAHLNAIVSRHEPIATALRAVSVLGGPPVTPLLVAVIAAGLLLRRQTRLALYLAVTGLGALVLDPTLKTLVGRLRPVVDLPVASAPGNSFPSGHALGSVVAYGAVLLILLPLLGPARRRAAIAAWAALVLLIGSTRVALGVHFVSDVLGGWLLGLAWLGVTAHAFCLWQRERGRPVPPVTHGLDPASGPALVPAPAEGHPLPHPWTGAAKILTGWVLVLGVLHAVGTLVTHLAGGSVLGRLDREVPVWFAAHRTPALDRLSEISGEAGGTHAVLLISLVAAVLIVAAWRRWRPVLFLALVMLGEITLFLASSVTVGRPRPPVENLDGPMATSSFPSGHVAAALCLWTALALLLAPRLRARCRPAPAILATLAVLVPAVVALSRLYRGMHHPSDILGALLLTALWTTVVHLIVQPHRTAPAVPASGTASDVAAGDATGAAPADAARAAVRDAPDGVRDTPGGMAGGGSGVVDGGRARSATGAGPDARRG